MVSFLNYYSCTVTKSVTKQLSLSIIHKYFYPEDEGDMFLQNITLYNTQAAPYPK
jgi:hypothetical protein